MKITPRIIAEIGSNHRRSLEHAKKLIDAAKEAGCDFVKFQLFFADEFIPKYIKASDYGFVNPYGDIPWQEILANELIFPHDLYPEIRRYCKSTQIGFGVTVHGPRSLDVASRLDIDFIKVASMDMNYYQLLKSLNRLTSPVILSTGMANMEEIKKAVEIVDMKSNDVLMHCTSEYPAVEKHISRIAALKTLGNFNVGYSDHTEDSVAAIGATCLGATWFEKHITLDKFMKGPDHSFAADPATLKQYVLDLNRASSLFEQDCHVELSAKEIEQRNNYRRSIVAAKNMAPGHIVTKNDIDFLRPGTGLAPEKEDCVIGATVTKFIAKDMQLSQANLHFD